MHARQVSIASELITKGVNAPIGCAVEHSEPSVTHRLTSGFEWQRRRASIARAPEVQSDVKPSTRKGSVASGDIQPLERQLLA